MKTNKNNIAVLASRMAYAQLAAAGAAPGISSRAKTQPSRKDKLRDNRQLRNRAQFE
jgi:hypothetical protein